MGSKLVLKNEQAEEFVIIHEDNDGAIEISAKQISGGHHPVADVDAMRLLESVPSTIQVTDGRYGSHFFKKVVSGSDNGGTIIETVNAIYELQFTGAINVKWFGAIAYNGVDLIDSKDSFLLAISVSLDVIIDEKYYLSSAIDAIDGINFTYSNEILIGGNYYPLMNIGVFAPNGFILNSGSRKKLYLKNIIIEGDGISGSKAIEGDFNLVAKGNYFNNYDEIIYSEAFYLSTLESNKFLNCNTALMIGDTNETLITLNWFSSSCLKPIDNVTLGGNSFPLNVIRNNFNIGATPVPMELKGSVNFKGNYLECYTAITNAETHLINYTAPRFAHPDFVFEENHFNGQDEIDYLLSIASDNTNGTDMRGSIRYNYIVGFIETPIKIESETSGKDDIVGLEVSGVNIEYNSAQYKSKSLNGFSASYTEGTLDISSSTYTRVPFGAMNDNIPPIGDMLATNLYIAPEKAIYFINFTGTIKVDAEKRVAESRILKNGVSVSSSTVSCSYAVAGGANYHTVTLTALVGADALDQLEVQIRNGDILFKSTITIMSINDNNFIPVS